MIADAQVVAAEQSGSAVQLGPVVIKLGGSVLDAAQGALDDVVALWRAGYPVVLAHGGGPAINRWLARLGVESRFVGGRRVTDAATLEVVRAVLGGQINTEIVRLLGQRGARAIGLSGLDAQLVRARRAPGDLGLVGVDPVADPSVVRAALAAGCLPVIAPLGLGQDGECLNVNADDAATAIAVALGAADLIFMSDVPGVLDAAGRAIPCLNSDEARQLIAAGVIAGGMAPKIEGCLAALARVQRVQIVAGDVPGIVFQAVTAHAHSGTRFIR